MAILAGLYHNLTTFIKCLIKPYCISFILLFISLFKNSSRFITMRRLIYSLFLSFLFCIAQAQIPVSSHFGNGELTCDLITEICQDEDGFIWVGTINGLNRYDG